MAFVLSYKPRRLAEMSRNTVISLPRARVLAMLLPEPQWPEEIATYGAKLGNAPRRMPAPAPGFMTLLRLIPLKPIKAVEDPPLDLGNPISRKDPEGLAPPKETVIKEGLVTLEEGENPLEAKVRDPSRRR